MRDDHPIIVRYSRRYGIGIATLATAMALFFAVVTIYAATRLPGVWAIGTLVFCVIFFASFASLAWWGWRWNSRGRVMAEISESGIVAAPESRAPLSMKWDEIQDVVLLRENIMLKRPRMLLVVPANPATFLSQLTPFLRLRMRLAWFLHRVKWAIAFGDGLEIPLEELGSHLASALGRPLLKR